MGDEMPTGRMQGGLMGMGGGALSPPGQQYEAKEAAYQRLSTKTSGQGPVSSVAEGLDNGLKQLGAELEALEVKLGPVLSEQPPQPEDPGAQPIPGTSVHTRYLWKAFMELSGAILKVRTLKDRIEL